MHVPMNFLVHLPVKFLKLGSKSEKDPLFQNLNWKCVRTERNRWHSQKQYCWKMCQDLFWNCCVSKCEVMIYWDTLKVIVHHCSLKIVHHFIHEYNWWLNSHVNHTIPDLGPRHLLPFAQIAWAKHWQVISANQQMFQLNFAIWVDLRVVLNVDPDLPRSQYFQHLTSGLFWPKFEVHIHVPSCARMEGHVFATGRPHYNNIHLFGGYL